MLLIFNHTAMHMGAMAAIHTVAVLIMATATVTATVTAMDTAMVMALDTMETATQRTIVRLIPGSTALKILMQLTIQIQLAGGVPTNNIDLPLSLTAPTISTGTSMGNATSRGVLNRIQIQRSLVQYSLLRSPGRLFRSEAPSQILEIPLQQGVFELVSTRMAIWVKVALILKILGNSTH